MELFRNIMLCISITSMALLSVMGLAYCIYYGVNLIKTNKQKRELDKEFALFLNKLAEAIVNETNTNDNDEEDEEQEEVKTVINYDSMTVRELKKIAQSKKIPEYYTMKRDELISVLKEQG